MEYITNVEPLLLVQLERDKLSLKKENVNKILSSVPAGLPVSVLNVVGPPQTGKLALLHYIVRYLSACENDEEHGWMESDSNGVLHWPNGDKRSEVQGIWGMNRPFILPLRSGSADSKVTKKVAVLLLYTPTSKESNIWWNAGSTAALLGLGIHLSSCTVFNVYKVLDETALSAVSAYVTCAARGGCLMGKSVGNKKSPQTWLQNGVFLVRDWSYPTTYSYGRAGGDKFLKEEKLREKLCHSRESRISRKIIGGMFANLTGYLLPHPGNKAILAENFFERQTGTRDRFLEQIQGFVESLFKLEMVAPKCREQGEPVLATELVTLMEQYIQVISREDDGSLTGTALLRRAGVKMTILPGEEEETVKKAVRAYVDVWKKLEKETQFLRENDIKEIHKKGKRKAQQTMGDLGRMGEDPEGDSDDGGGVSEKAKRLLNDKLTKMLKEMKEGNERRRKKAMSEYTRELLEQYAESMNTSCSADVKLSDKRAAKASVQVVEQLKRDFLQKLGADDEDGLDDQQDADYAEFVTILGGRAGEYLRGA